MEYRGLGWGGARRAQGIAPEAKLFFTDVQLNADPACNDPAALCTK